MIYYFQTASNAYPSWLAMATDTVWLADGHTDRHDDTYYVINEPDTFELGNLRVYHVVQIYTCQSTVGSSFPLDCVEGVMQGPGNIPAGPLVTLLDLPAAGYFDPANFIGDPDCEAFAYDDPPVIPDFWVLCFQPSPVKGDPHVVTPEYAIGIVPSPLTTSPLDAFAYMTTIYPYPPSSEVNDTNADFLAFGAYPNFAYYDRRNWR